MDGSSPGGRRRRRPRPSNTKPSGRSRTGIALLAGLSLLAAACGSDGGAGEARSSVPATDAAVVTGAPATQAPVTADRPAGTTGDATQSPDGADAAPVDTPERIVSLSPTHTEMLFAMGADDLLVAVDEFSYYPEEALALPHDLSGFEPNIEALAAYEPDLVITGGDFTGVGAQLETLGIDSWDGPAPATVDGIYAQILELGDVIGRPDDAAALVDSMRSELDGLVAATPPPAEPLHVYHELDPTYFSIDSTTFIGNLYSLFGLRNIADEAESGDSGGYPQLNAEFIVSTDPELIFLADTKCCGESLATVSARDGWDAMTAVRNGAVFEMDDDIASRWGPRIVDYAAAVAAALAQVAAPA
jgi:iron complex transport system substrate-binding protein